LALSYFHFEEARMNLRALFFATLLALLTVQPSRAFANDDMVQFGADITTPAGHPIHDAVCFFCSVHADGEVSGDLVVFFGDVYLNGTAHHDVVNFFGRTRLAENAIVQRNLVNFFGSVRASESTQVGGDMVIIFGSLKAPASLGVGGSRIMLPAVVLWVPFLFFASIIFVIVRAFRDWQRRRSFYAAYPVPPHP
jgi:hypothetical protein